MQADLLKRLMRNVQAPQKRARQVGLKAITSHHCSLVKGPAYDSSFNMSYLNVLIYIFTPMQTSCCCVSSVTFTSVVAAFT